ncbi:MAG: 30S ribosomal protein S15 [Candidatus Cloacimonetes bacterium]|nr:30S ribosomal protein S15 [Candidatus Cloacimonadota bacterium]MBS3766851.1 30S ribosomal protein S15 [Candidatus Cloacimonadota bacterium]
MSLSKQTKQEIVNKFQTHPDDTGSPEVQIALLTHRIQQITEHLKKFKKDHNTRRSLLKLVGQRRKLLDYLKQVDIKRYRTLLNALNLRK